MTSSQEQTCRSQMTVHARTVQMNVLILILESEERTNIYTRFIY